MIAAILMIALLSSADARPAPFESLRPYLIGIGVENADDSAKWYETTLGFQTYHRMEVPERGLKIVFLRSGGFGLELVETAGAAPLKRYVPALKDAMLVHGLKKIAFRVSDLAAAAASLKAQGVQFVVEPFDDRPMKLRSFIVADPDGNLLQFVQEMK